MSLSFRETGAASADRRLPGERSGDEQFHDPWWLPHTQDAELALAEAIRLATAAAGEGRQRRRRQGDRIRFEQIVASYVCDLWRRKAAGLGDAIIVTRAKRKLDAAKGRYDHPAITGSAVGAQDALVASGLCECVAGHWGGSQAPGRGTTLRATPRLQQLYARARQSDFTRDPAEEVILLRAEKEDVTLNNWSREKPGKLIDFADDVDTCRMRRDLQTINAHLEGADIVLDDGVLASFTEARFDPTSRRLYRIFSNGRFDSGGRLYRGFWIGLPSVSRREVLQIDGQPIEILDYGQMSARLAYAKVGAVLPEGDLYAVPGIEAWQREGVKILVNAALYSSAPLTKKPRGAGKLLPNVNVAELMSVLRQVYAPVAHLFESGEGLRLQRTESDIIVEVLLRLTGMGITALPIHDAVIVGEPHRLKARAVMKDVFREMSGVEAVVSRG